MVGKPKLGHSEHDFFWGRMESSPVRDVRPRHSMGGPGATAGEGVPSQMAHEVDRDGDAAGGSDERDDSDLSSFVQGTAPWRKRPSSEATPATPTHVTTSVRRLTPPTTSSGAVASSSTREEPTDDLGGTRPMTKHTTG